MPFLTTRRRLLGGTLGTAAAATTGCARPKPASEQAHVDPSAAPPVAAATRVEAEINGVARALDVDAEGSALALVRDTLDLTGSKRACGHGACGACTMLIDGEPTVTCLLPATALHGRKVTTVEGLAKGELLHPVQRAFMAEDALQCGFCTPGFVTAGAAFYTKWRAARGQGAVERPDRETVAAALSGHLCRCGAYDNILTAVQRACAGEYEAPTDASPRYDAREKVTGAAKYTVDIRHPGQLEGRILRSPHAHAKIKRVDWSRALTLPGVAGVVDLLGGVTTVRFAGQEILALAAVDERTADEALAQVVVEYEVLPALIGMPAALAPGAPAVYPTRNTRKQAPNGNEGPLLPVGWEGNLRGPFKLFAKNKGAVRRSIAALKEDPAAGVLVEATYRTQVQCHTTLEPHACVARWSGPDSLEVWLSTAAVHAVAEDIAERWGLKREQVRLFANYVGGGFGSKNTLQLECVAAVELARVCGEPVRVALERREELIVGGLRPAQDIEVTIAASTAGEARGIRAHAYSDAGVAVGAASTALARIMYPYVGKDIADWDVITHGPPGKPFRAPGGPPMFWALEQAVDTMAHRLGVDPVALRRKWDPNPARNRLYDWVSQLPAWKDRPAPQSDRGRFRRGTGLAIAGWFYFVQPSSRVQIDAGPDGIVASTAAQDIGNGTRSVIAAVVAEVLGVAPASVQVKVGDSHFVPGPMAGGSRSTASIGPAARHAAEQLRDELTRRAALQGVQGVAAAGGVKHAGGLLPWAKILAAAPKLTFIGVRRRDKGGYFLPPMMDTAPGKYISGALQVTEIEVDTRLGRIKVVRSHTGVAIGKVVTPVLARSQVQGAVIQGISYALYEERRLDPRTGVQLTGGLEDYRIAGVGDVGELDVHFVEDGYERVNGRSVGMAELATLAPAASIGNALFHATGWRPLELPLRPDRVLQGVRA